MVNSFIVNGLIQPIRTRLIKCFTFIVSTFGHNIYPTKKKRNSKIFPLSFPFNAKMLIVIKN